MFAAHALVLPFSISVGDVSDFRNFFSDSPCGTTSEVNLYIISCQFRTLCSALLVDITNSQRLLFGLCDIGCNYIGFYEYMVPCW